MPEITKEQLAFLINAKQQYLNKIKENTMSMPSIIKNSLAEELHNLRQLLNK